MSFEKPLFLFLTRRDTAKSVKKENDVQSGSQFRYSSLYSFSCQKVNAVALKDSVSGIVGEVDLDYAYKDYPKIIKNARLNGFTAAGDSDKTDNSNRHTGIDFAACCEY